MRDPIVLTGLSRRRFLVTTIVLMGGAAATACGRGSATAPAASPTGARIEVNPTATSVPAPPTATSAPAPTATSAPEPTATPKPGPRTSQVNVLYEMTGPDGRASGGTSVFKITVAPKDEAGIRVSFSESEVGGQGTQMRAAGWTAAVISCLTLGIDPSKLGFTYDIAGKVDGPSAGALLTVGTLAAVLGNDVFKDFAMTGTINPDLSIGPVGGIPQKIEGAAKAGIKTILVPIGQRTDVDLNTNKPVDLVRLGEDLGVAVKPVANIHDAYYLATGEVLPEPKAGPRPDWPSDVFGKLQAQAKDWQAFYNEHRQHFNSYSPDVRKYYTDWMKEGDNAAASGQKALTEGQHAVALERFISASETALRGDQLGNFVQTIKDRGLNAALNAVKASNNSAQTLAALSDTLREERAATASDAVGLIDAYSNRIVAEVHVLEAASALDGLSKSASKMKPEDIAASLLEIVDYNARAEIAIRVAKTNLDTWMGHGKGKAPDKHALDGLADILRHAAEANMAAFESLVVQDIAQQYNVRNSAVRDALMSKDENYLIAYYTMNQLGSTTSKSTATELQQTYYNLGGALNTYALSTQLISKYYSLDAKVDKNFNITGYGRQAALQNMLELAEHHSDLSLGLSKDVPLPALYYSDNAKAYREQGASQKMDALNYFWQSSILSDVLANLTGEFGAELRAAMPHVDKNVQFLKANSF